VTTTLTDCLFSSGELDPGEDQEHDTSDDGEGLRVVNVPGDCDETTAGSEGERSVAGTILRQRGEGSSAVRRNRTGIKATDADRGTATAGTT